VEPVQIAEYDPAWPALFERERGLIAGVLGDLAAAIEHVGSTAVPGLGGKPVIDMMVAVRDVFDEGQRCVAPLEGLGYEYKGELGIPGRLYFRKLTQGRWSHQIHTVESGSDLWERHLLFRDYLRGQPDEAEAYYELKVRLAAEFRTDREGYTEAKTRFIEAALVRARAAAR
jgi:GrpB-like predicted nucleotidyltransferase (UPF0157 family)